MRERQHHKTREALKWIYEIVSRVNPGEVFEENPPQRKQGILQNSEVLGENNRKTRET